MSTVLDSKPLLREGALRRFLEPSVWLSGRLSFSQKYLLIGAVVLLGLSALSIPLWQKVVQDRSVAELERQGLSDVGASAELLSRLVELRASALNSGPMPVLNSVQPAIDQQLAAATRRRAPTPLPTRWQELLRLDAQSTTQQRFAAFNGAINSVLTLMQSSAQHHRLNVDLELDSAVAMLSLRLPQVLDTLGKQQGAMALESAEMAPLALGAQVTLTESVAPLKEGTAQLARHRPDDPALQPQLDRLLDGVARQQDAADKAADDPKALEELKQLARSNEALARQFFDSVVQATDDHLAQRIAGLRRTQWIIGGLLVGTLAALTYLFAGIYLSALRSLNRLASGTADFCAGRLDTRIQLDTQDELVLVARNFNTMAGEFSRLLRLIQEQNESRERELATQVQARTAELAEKNVQLSLAGQRVQEELSLARDMQRAILPQDFPDEATWAVHALMFPARELGGDFYDVLRLPDDRWGILVADVSGKGVAAAFFMAVSRTVLLDLAMTGLAPGQVLAQANELLCQRNPMELFVTVCYGVYEPATGRLVYASGGHPPPLLRRAAGQVHALHCTTDLALAVLPDQRYSDLETELAPGDSLLLFTDGVTEAFSAAGEAYGDARLQTWFARAPAARGAHALVDALVKDVETFVDGAEASDDLTCLMLSRKQGESTMSSQTVNLTNKVLLLDYQLPSQLQEIEKLATAVSNALPDRPDLAFSANLCLEELITNTILHGLKGESNRVIHVRMSMSDEWLEIILKDDAPPFDPFNEAPEPNLDLDIVDRPIGGLGVHLVKSLMDDARAYYDGSGNLIVLLKTLRQ